MIYRSLLRPLLFRLPPETAHNFALYAAAGALQSKAARRLVAPFFEAKEWNAAHGALKRFGLEFGNPVGLAAGFDKNGEAAQALAAFGFGFLELGTVTRHAQLGNPRPRIFRLPEDRAIINRAGFNNEGAQTLADKLRRGRPTRTVGINIGKSRIAPLDEATEDYLASFEIVYDAADYIAVNVSSPNTPGLRELQRADALSELLGALQKRNRELAAQKEARAKPLLVKIAPDVELRELDFIVDVARRAGISGVIATNTTTSRAGLRTPQDVVAAFGEGGLSGAPLRERATNIVAELYTRAGDDLKIVGVGGIFNAEDAWEKICAGASLVQMYTGFIYEGFAAVRNICDGLVRIMQREGVKNLDEAVGSRAHELLAK